jgi:hypothetical protein
MTEEEQLVVVLSTIKYFVSINRFIRKTEVAVNTDFKPVQRFQNRSYVMTFWNTCDSTSSRVKNKLKTIKLICRRVEK